MLFPIHRWHGGLGIALVLGLLLGLVVSSPTVFPATAANSRYFIIAPDAWSEALQPLVLLKQGQGFQVILVPLSQAGGDAQAIKDYLRARNLSLNPPDYVLLVGDEQIIPTWVSKINPNVRTDLYYTTMDGSLDYTPNFYLGRLPLTSAAEVARAVSAWQSYAAASGGEAWLRRAAFLATDYLNEYAEVESTLTDIITRYTAPRGYLGSFPLDGQPGGDRLYAKTHAARKADVQAALAEGRALLVYLGEMEFTALSGGATLSGWKAPAFDQNDVRALNASPIPLVLSLAPRSADFMLGESLGETWVRHPEHGALAFLGASGERYWSHDRLLAQAFFAALFAPNTPSLAQALDGALAAVASQYPDAARLYRESYQLFGDPAMQVRLFSLAGDFSLALEPPNPALCLNGMSLLQVQVESLNGFSAPVTLTLPDLPTGFLASFSPSSLTPPAHSTLTLSASGHLSAGAYPLWLAGAGGGMEHRLPFTLTLFTQAPTPPTLAQPMDGAAGVSLQPRLAWQPPPGEAPATYILEIATEPTFATPWLQVEDLSQAFYDVPVPLSAATTFYWRVRAVNACGQSAFSATGHFTTRPLPGECPDGVVPQVLYSTSVAANEPNWSLQGSGNTWSVTSAGYRSPPFAFGAPAPARVAVAPLISPSVSLPAAASGHLPLSLAFWLRYGLEGTPPTCYDGLVLEVSTDDGATWQPLPDSALLAAPARGTLASSFGNPLGGARGWCGTQDWTRVLVDLNDYAGQTLRLRWSLGSDDANGGEGAFLDDLMIQGCDYAPRYEASLLPVESVQIGQAGETVLHTLRLTNLSNVAATFDLYLTSGDWGALLLSPSSLTLGSGEAAEIAVQVSIPVAGNALEDRAVLRAVPQGDNNAAVEAVLITQQRRADFEIFNPLPDLAGRPGERVIFPITLRNRGNVALVLNLSAASEQGWRLILPAQVSLPVDGEQTIPLVLDVPADAWAGAHDTLTFSATAAEAPQPSRTVTLGVNVLAVYQPWVSVSDPPACLPPGMHHDLTFEISNRGNAEDTFLLQTTHNTWISTEVLPGCTLTLPAGGSNLCTLRVTVDSNTIPGIYTLGICAYSTHETEKHLCVVLSMVHVGYCRVYLPLIRR